MHGIFVPSEHKLILKLKLMMNWILFIKYSYVANKVLVNKVYFQIGSNSVNTYIVHVVLCEDLLKIYRIFSIVPTAAFQMSLEIVHMRAFDMNC